MSELMRTDTHSGPTVGGAHGGMVPMRSSSDATVLGALAIGYPATTAADWDTEPTDVQEALDYIAAGGVLDYTLVDGTRPFTGTVGGIDPVASTDLATKEYVDTSIGIAVDYLFNNTASDIGGIYYDMTDDDLGGAESTLSTAGLGAGDDQALVNFATLSGVPGITSLRSGVYVVHFHAEKTAGTRSVNIYAEVWVRTVVPGETLLLTTEVSGVVTSKASFVIHGNLATDTPINDTDRIIVKFYANVGAAGSAATVALYQEGDTASHLSLATTSDVLSNVFLRQDGTKPLTADWDAGSHKITAEQLASDIAIGTAPLLITSTDVCTNLNADYVDGLHVSTSGNALGALDGTNAWSGAQTMASTTKLQLDNAANYIYSAGGVDLTANGNTAVILKTLGTTRATINVNGITVVGYVRGSMLRTDSAASGVSGTITYGDTAFQAAAGLGNLTGFLPKSGGPANLHADYWLECYRGLALGYVAWFAA